MIEGWLRLIQKFFLGGGGTKQRNYIPVFPGKETDSWNAGCKGNRMNPRWTTCLWSEQKMGCCHSKVFWLLPLHHGAHWPQVSFDSGKCCVPSTPLELGIILTRADTLWAVLWFNRINVMITGWDQHNQCLMHPVTSYETLCLHHMALYTELIRANRQVRRGVI